MTILGRSAIVLNGCSPLGERIIFRGEPRKNGKNEGRGGSQPERSVRVGARRNELDTVTKKGDRESTVRGLS